MRGCYHFDTGGPPRCYILESKRLTKHQTVEPNTNLPIYSLIYHGMYPRGDGLTLSGSIYSIFTCVEEWCANANQLRIIVRLSHERDILTRSFRTLVDLYDRAGLFSKNNNKLWTMEVEWRYVHRSMNCFLFLIWQWIEISSSNVGPLCSLHR